jgi:hypothetical protein
MHTAVDMKKHKELQHRCERLEKFIKILQDAPFTKAASLDEKIMYIDSLIFEEYTVNLLCEALQISKTTYYNRKLRGKGGQTEKKNAAPSCSPLFEKYITKAGRYTAPERSQPL